MTLILTVTIVSREILIFSKMVEYIRMKMLEINGMQRKIIRTSYYFIILLPDFSNCMSFVKKTNKAWNNVYYENILFHKNSWMSSQENAWNQCKVQNYN